MTDAKDDGLDHAVLVTRERKARERRDRSLARSVAMVGGLGWLIVAPALAGVALGRWLDRILKTGIALTSACVFVGLAVGCALAWRRMRE